MVLKMSTRAYHIGALRSIPKKRFPLSNSRTLSDINFILGMLIGLDEWVDGIEDEHQGAPYGGARGRTPKTVSAL